MPLVTAALALACATAAPPPVTKVAVPAPPPPPPPPPARIEGVVKGPDGAPLPGADVALVPVDPAWRVDHGQPAGAAHTGEDGRFSFGGLAAGEYRLSALAPGLTPRFGSRVTVALGDVKPVEVQLGGEGISVRGAVTDAFGRPVPGARLVVAPAQGDEGFAYAPVDAAGAFDLLLPRGEYAFEAFADGFEPQSLGAAVWRARSVTLPLETPPVTSPAPPEVAEWLKQAALPLATVEPGSDFEDLRPLSRVLSGVRVVGLGEATHGTHEFFRLKHRLLEYLATEQGFTLFAIEANFSEAQALNEYVLTGKGDPAKALAGLYFWITDTEEMLDLVRWMRAYNAEPRHKRKLRFYGFDMQFSPGATRAVLDYLAKVDPAYLAQVEPSLQPLLEKDALGAGQGKAREKVAPFAPVVTELATRMVIKRSAYVRRSGEREWALAARHARVLGQFIESNLGGDYTQRIAVRDESMAENVRWILEQAGPDARMVLWAHNGHVAKWRDGQLHPGLGQRLHEALGTAYYAFGFAFGEGSFQAVYLPGGAQDPWRGLMPHTVPPTPPDAVDATLLSTGLPLFAVDLRSAPEDGAVGSYWHERRRMREVGSMYAEGRVPLASVRVGEDFDGLMFVARTTAAHPTPTGQRPPPKAAPAPQPESAPPTAPSSGSTGPVSSARRAPR